MKVTTYTATGSKASTETTLDKSVFEVMPKTHDLIAQAYETARHNSRTINAYAKTRGEVSGGGKKPWKQKGTGRARAGTIRSPIWRGGGITFGPTGELRTMKISKNSRNTALKQALSVTAKDGDVIVIADFDTKDGKTKTAAELIKKLGIEGRILIVTEEDNSMTSRATRNIVKVTTTTAMRLNVSDVIDASKIVITKKALDVLTARLGAKNV